MVVITGVLPHSRAEKAGIKPGDYLLEINSHEINDVLDYRFRLADTTVILKLHRGPDIIEKKIKKEEYDDIGLEFGTPLMDKKHRCENGCIFCFIDQNPEGMRETIYFKDDDSRLAFLHGNYITLTNLHEADIDRIIEMHISPVNISVHTTNPELRVKMLHNRFAGKIMETLNRLRDADIEMNGQIVLCKGVNDGAELERSIRDLAGLYPQMQSMSVVPVGLSKYREGLYPLEPLTKEDAENALDIIGRFQNEMYERFGTHFVHASDEFYLLANRPLPPEEVYDGYVQLENGVGMLRLLIEETDYALEALSTDERVHTLSLATGKLAYPFLKDIAAKVHEKFPNVNITVYEILNDFFGHGVTVSGLITGQDLIKQLKGKPLGEVLLLPANMFRSNEEVFLDDLTKQDVEKALQVPINIVKSDGQELIRAMLMEESEETKQLHSPYEL